MSSPILIVLAGAVGLVTTAVGVVSLTQVSTSRFDYETASDAERIEYLKAQSGPIGSAMKRNLVSPSGVGPTMRMADTEIDPGRREIRFTIRVVGPTRRSANFDAIETAIYKRICPTYVKSALARNTVTVVHSFVGDRDRNLLDISISPDTCSRYI